MSINVTVTGSPVTIRRGKMMWIDPKEIQKKQFQMKKQQRLLEVAAFFLFLIIHVVLFHTICIEFFLFNINFS